MFRLFFTPGWFHGWDIVFDLVSLLIALLIAAYSWRWYRLNKENRFAYFALAFILVSLGLLFKSFTSMILYYTPVRDVAADLLRPLAGERLSLSGLYYRAAFFLQMLSMLGAWLLLFFVSQKPRARLHKFYEVSQIALFIYLLVLISIVSNFKYSVFYLTSSVILGLVVLNYYKNYLNTNNNQQAFKVMLSMMFILAGNITYIFIFLFNKLYVLGEILMLIGFLILLFTYKKVTRR